MRMNFIPLNFSCLDNIQDDVSKLIKIPEYQTATLFYQNDHVNLFLTSKYLRDELQKINLLEDVFIIAVIIVEPGKKIPIHTDTMNHNDIGGFSYSLNIPISGYNQTVVNFYRPLGDNNGTHIALPRERDNASGIAFRKFDINECELIETHESNIPYIMDTRVPHDVVNHSNNERIFLLVRLRNSANKKIESMLGRA